MLTGARAWSQIARRPVLDHSTTGRPLMRALCSVSGAPHFKLIRRSKAGDTACQLLVERYDMPTRHTVTDYKLGRSSSTTTGASNDVAAVVNTMHAQQGPRNLYDRDGKIELNSVPFLPRDALCIVQSAVLPSHVVCPSVRL